MENRPDNAMLIRSARGGQGRDLRASIPDRGSFMKKIEAIQNAAAMGRIGDGKIFVTAVEEAIRVRTGERGTEAI